LKNELINKRIKGKLSGDEFIFPDASIASLSSTLKELKSTDNLTTNYFENIASQIISNISGKIDQQLSARMNSILVEFQKAKQHQETDTIQQMMESFMTIIEEQQQSISKKHKEIIKQFQLMEQSAQARHEELVAGQAEIYTKIRELTEMGKIFLEKIKSRTISDDDIKKYTPFITNNECTFCGGDISDFSQRIINGENIKCPYCRNLIYSPKNLENLSFIIFLY